MSKILAIKHVATKAGKPNVLVSTAAQDVWVPFGQWQSKGASAILDGYVGGSIETDFYAKGELLLNGQECTQDGIILRDFSVSMNPQVAAYAAAAEAMSRSAAASDAAAIFRRRRLEKKDATPDPKITEPDPEHQEA